MKKQKQFEAFIDWYSKPVAERSPPNLRGFSVLYKVSLPSLYKWEKKVLREQGDYGSRDISEFMERIYQLAMNGKNAKYAELWSRLKGLLIDKAEIKHEFRLGADAYYRIERKADAELREFRASLPGVAGAPQVQEGLSLLPDPIRDNKRPDSGEDTVPALGAPDKPA